MNVDVAQWVQDLDNGLKTTTRGESYDQLHQRLIHRTTEFYDEFLPTRGAAHPDFDQRLATWLGLVSETRPATRRLMFELVDRIVFFTRDDFAQLHQAAVHGPVSRWLIDLLTLDITSPQCEAQLQRAIEDDTWYCPLSDSMPIADFYHVNTISGVELRPEFRTVDTFSDIRHVQHHMHKHNMNRVVVLEDFIGSGAQLSESIGMFDALVHERIPTLVVPLIVCPDGHRYLTRTAANSRGVIGYEPVLRLDEVEFVANTRRADEDVLFSRLRRVVKGTYPLVEGNGAAAPRPYGPFGFQDTGGLVVLFGNSPANTLPIIQHNSDTWEALFPRTARV